MAVAPELHDLELVLKSWAWNTFSKTRSKDHAKIKYDDVHMEVNWNGVRFHTADLEYIDGRLVDRTSSQIVFRAKYENWTDHEQENSFQTERTTTSACTTAVQKGYTKGFHLELKLGLPEEVAAATAGFGREVNMESAEEETHEKSVTWSINSTIKVPPKHRTTAELVVKEKEYNGSFRMKVHSRGRVLVVLTNLRDNNSFLQTVEGEFFDVIKSELGKDARGVVFENRTVTWNIEGKCHFRFGVEQHVQLREEVLEES